MNTDDIQTAKISYNSKELQQRANGAAAFASPASKSKSSKDRLAMPTLPRKNSKKKPLQPETRLQITSDGNVTTLAGSGSQAYADGVGSAASFYLPSGIAVDSSGNVFVADTSNQVIRKIPSSGTVTTLAGTGNASFSDGAWNVTKLNSPFGIAVDSSGNVYVADTNNAKIRKISLAGYVSTIAGTGTQGFFDGAASLAQFYYLRGVAVVTLYC